MPVFIQQPKRSVIQGVAHRKKIPQKTVEKYRTYIEQLEDSNEGFLTFEPHENIREAREALKEAGRQLKKYVRVTKVRGSDNMLRFERIHQWVYDNAQKAARKVEAQTKKNGTSKKPRKRKKTTRKSRR